MNTELIYTVFKGRTDKVGVTSTGTIDKTISIDVKSDQDILHKIEEHLAGTRRLGFYNKLPDITVPWAVIEFEDHGREEDIKNAAEISLEFMNHMKSVDINVYRELSKNPNGKCFHMWIFFDKPQPAKKVNLA